MCFPQRDGTALPYDRASLIFLCCFLRYAPLIIHHDVRQSSTIFLSDFSSFFAPRHHESPWRVHAKFPFAVVITHALINRHSSNRQPIINTMFRFNFYYSPYVDTCSREKHGYTRWLHAENESGLILSFKSKILSKINAIDKIRSSNIMTNQWIRRSWRYQ